MPSPSPAVASASATLPPADRRADSPAEALGRRLLSTAFVRLGPGGHLTVELSDGRAVVLRDVVMRADDYCGVQVAGQKYCGGYADVVAARPDGAPPATPAAPAPGPAKPL